MKKLIEALNKKGRKDLVIRIKVVKAEYDDNGDIVYYMATVLEDNKKNFKGNYSLFIDEDSIDPDSCTFFVQDEDGEEHGRLSTSFTSESGAGETVLSWSKFKAKDFDNPSLAKALAAFLKRNTLNMEFTYTEGPYERQKNADTAIENAVKQYVDKLLTAVMKYLK